jgi:hypothetical protein
MRLASTIYPYYFASYSLNQHNKTFKYEKLSATAYAGFCK